MRRKQRPQGSISIHRNYTIEEASRAMGVHRQTVLRWVKAGDLRLIDGRRPFLILGSELVGLRRTRRSRRQKCRLEQAWCFRCREAKGAAFNAAEIIDTKGRALNVRMLCETCSTVMHKRVARDRIPALAAVLSLTQPQDRRRLTDADHPCPNAHL